MDKNDKYFIAKTYFVVSCSILILICITFTGTHAYYSASTKISSGNPTTTVTTVDLKDFELSGGNQVSSNNMLPGDSVTTNFTLKNLNNFEQKIRLYWSAVTNTFVNQTDLVVSLECDANGTGAKSNVLGSSTKTFPSKANEVLLDKFSMPANTTKNCTLKVTYNNSPSSNQIADQGKSFSGTLSLGAATS